MSDKIRGTFPGGPSRSDSSPQREGPLRTAPVEDLEAARAARSVARARKARRRRVALGFLVAVLLAGGAGILVGIQSHVTPAQLSAEVEAARAQDLDISREVNRALLEIWRMEEVEAQRNEGNR